MLWPGGCSAALLGQVKALGQCSLRWGRSGAKALDQALLNGDMLPCY